MTDNEIIKALECCKDRSCCGCPCNIHSASCLDLLTQSTLDLINRQNAEIEMLKKTIEVKDNIYQRNTGLREKRIFDLMDELKQAKAEAIKEFEERFSNSIDEKVDDIIKALNPHLYIAKEIARDIVKEMVGDAE